MGTTLTESQVVALIRDGQKGKTLRDYAGEIGIHPSYLNDIFSGSRKPGPKILKYFGISKRRQVIVTYTVTKPKAA